VALAPGQSRDEVFDRLDPLFRTEGTSHERRDDTLTFHKKDPAAQDKMSIFDDGVLQIEDTDQGAVLTYRLTSRALLMCFLAPLLFLGIGGLTIAVGKLEPPPPAAAQAEKKKAEAKLAAMPMNPIDKLLGAPAPEKPKKDKEKEKDKKRSPTPSYVFAAIFAALYVVGRFLEDWLVNRNFRKHLLGE
jgi:hypothetical protein